MKKRIHRRSAAVPSNVKYISVEKMKEAIARRDRFKPRASDPTVWRPSQAEIDAASRGSFDMLQFVKAMLNQGELGSCTAFGWTGAVATKHMMKSNKFLLLSQLYLYYYERVKLGTVDEDSGAEVVDGADVLSQRGCPLSESYPYKDDNQTFKNKPPASLDVEAGKYKIVEPLQVTPAVPHIKAALKAGMPIVFGFMVYKSFESGKTASTGVVTMPKPGEEELGGHCVYAVGYTDSRGKVRSFGNKALVANIGAKAPKNSLICVNSWGERWGDKGVFYMPWAFVEKYAADYYIFKDVTGD